MGGKEDDVQTRVEIRKYIRRVQYEINKIVTDDLSELYKKVKGSNTDTYEY